MLWTGVVCRICRCVRELPSGAAGCERCSPARTGALIKQGQRRVYNINIYTHTPTNTQSHPPGSRRLEVHVCKRRGIFLRSSCCTPRMRVACFRLRRTKVRGAISNSSTPHRREFLMSRGPCRLHRLRCENRCAFAPEQFARKIALRSQFLRFALFSIYFRPKQRSLKK